jgi:thiosulfate/3-mercaptopyruvate sulfurtransferase
MKFTTTISVKELSRHLHEPNWAIIDSRFKLALPEQGRMDYVGSHIPGAIYAHLDRDLSGPVIQGVTGRHPMPSIEHITSVFSRFGIDSDVQVVAYDDQGGALAAARVWWLLRWLGHEAAAVLNGGWQEWVRQKLPTRQGTETYEPREFIPQSRNEFIVSTQDVEGMHLDPAYRLLDARSADRFRGENETIDPVAGHIPGAISAPYADNLNPDGTFKDNEQILNRYLQLVGDVPIDHVVCYCGSGVTSAHDILAMIKAGLGEAKLYAGSFSEWINDPRHPVVK